MIGDKIIAEAGKMFRRISDGVVFGNEIYLGIAYPRDGEPYEEQPEDFEEIDDPTEAEIILLDEETALFDNRSTPITLVEEQPEVPIEDPVRHVVTLSDYRELERKVELLMKLIEEE